jgi:hypothetical protein
MAEHLGDLLRMLSRFQLPHRERMTQLLRVRLLAAGASFRITGNSTHSTPARRLPIIFFLEKLGRRPRSEYFPLGAASQIQNTWRNQRVTKQKRPTYATHPNDVPQSQMSVLLRTFERSHRCIVQTADAGDDRFLGSYEEEDDAWNERMEKDHNTDDLVSMSEWIFKNFGSHEKLPAALEVEPEMKFRMWLSLLGEIWCSCDNIGTYHGWLLELFDDKLARPWGPVSELMDAEERLAFDVLPDRITIYRGCGAQNKYGPSWSLNREMAAAFPFKSRYRTDRRPMLLTATIHKNRAAALKLNRHEQEIIVLGLSEYSWTEQPLKDPPGASSAR